MESLRWILLGVWLLLIGCLIWWDRRRGRMATPEDLPQSNRDETVAQPATYYRMADRQRTQDPQLVSLPVLGPPAAIPRLRPLYPEDARTQETDATIDLPEIPASSETVANVVAGAAEDDEEESVTVLPPRPASDSVVAAPPVPKLIVDWPPEGPQCIVAVRLMPVREERLSGRLTRLALQGLGFQHGPFGIYHQPSSSGHAQLSAASLSKPGTLDPKTIDFQRISGISLFAVLPGPLSADEAVDHLLSCSQELAQRMDAQVRDDKGDAINPAAIERLRTAARRGAPASA